MTAEQKAKAYDKAIETARKELKQDLHESGVWAIQRIFPELRESEDERIRKEIIEYLWDISNQTPLVKESLDCRRWIAWLEKQKEQKPNFDIHWENGSMVCEQKGQKLVEWSEDTMDEFTRNIRNLITDKLTVHTKGLDGSEVSSTVFIDDKTAKDIASGVLFYVGKEATKNPNREIPEWSEEDEKMRENLLYLMLENNSQDSWEGTYEWLKSLRPSWKPSEEELVALKRVGSMLRDYGHSELAKMVFMIEGKLANLSVVNKSIWKPREEQMEALKKAINKLAKTDVADSVRLSIMYDNLKKL